MCDNVWILMMIGFTKEGIAEVSGVCLFRLNTTYHAFVEIELYRCCQHECFIGILQFFNHFCHIWWNSSFLLLFPSSFGYRSRNFHIDHSRSTSFSCSFSSLCVSFSFTKKLQLQLNSIAAYIAILSQRDTTMVRFHKGIIWFNMLSSTNGGLCIAYSWIVSSYQLITVLLCFCELDGKQKSSCTLLD